MAHDHSATRGTGLSRRRVLQYAAAAGVVGSPVLSTGVADAATGSLSGRAPKARLTARPRLTRNRTTGQTLRNGVAFRTAGANIFQLINNDYPSASGRLMSTAEIGSLLAKAVAKREYLVRSHTFFANVGPNPWNLVTGVSGTGANPKIRYNEAVAVRMDAALDQMERLGLYLMAPLFDQPGSYAGSLLSWLRFRNPAAGDFEAFYTDPQCLADQQRFARDMMSRISTVNGKAYRDHAAMAIVETGNEMWKGDSHRTWSPTLAQSIKGHSPQVLVADGQAADLSTYWLTAGNRDPVEHVVTTEVLASPYIDYVGIHPYETATVDQLHTAMTRAAAAGKGFILGEYPWSKSTAPTFEAACRGHANCLGTTYWSLQNDSDLHFQGAAYGTDDVSLTYPGKDAVQVAANARLLAHAKALEAANV